MSAWDMSQPPKMSPRPLVSFGIAMVRMAGRRSPGGVSKYTSASSDFHRLPAGIRLEAVAMLAVQGLETLQDRVLAAAADVVDWAAAERRETRTEDHAGIQQLGVGNHAFAQAGDGLVQHREDQPVLQVGRAELGAGRILPRLALVVIAVEAFAGLFAELLRLDHLLETLRHGMTELLAEDARDGQRDVQADGVGKFDRPHRHAEVLRRLVDG